MGPGNEGEKKLDKRRKFKEEKRIEALGRYLEEKRKN